MTTNILHLDASARHQGSVTRELSAAIVERLTTEHGGATIVRRDLNGGEPMLDETFVAATFTPPEALTDIQSGALAHSDTLIEELDASDTTVIGLPVYNFGVPASLKTWIDQIARVGVTFRYTENGPEGLLTGKRVIVAYASGGTPLGADYDFATPYLRHIFGFLGIGDVSFETQNPATKAA